MTPFGKRQFNPPAESPDWINNATMNPTISEIETNCKFADFLNWEKLEDGRYYFSLFEPEPVVKCPPQELAFHRYWNWMMPVVEKIEALPEHPFHGKFGVYISSNSCTIQGTRLRTGGDNPNYAYFSEFHGDTKLEATWFACSSFLDWYKTISY